MNCLDAKNSSKMFLNSFDNTCVSICPKSSYIEQESSLVCKELSEDIVCSRVSFVFPSELSTCDSTSSMELTMAPSEKQLSFDTISLSVLISGHLDPIIIFQGRNSESYLTAQDLSFSYDLQTVGKFLSTIRVTHSSGFTCSKTQTLTMKETETILVEKNTYQEIKFEIWESPTISLQLFHLICSSKTAYRLRKKGSECKMAASFGRSSFRKLQLINAGQFKRLIDNPKLYDSFKENTPCSTQLSTWGWKAALHSHWRSLGKS